MSKKKMLLIPAFSSLALFAPIVAISEVHTADKEQEYPYQLSPKENTPESLFSKYYYDNIDELAGIDTSVLELSLNESNLQKVKDFKNTKRFELYKKVMGKDFTNFIKYDLKPFIDSIAGDSALQESWQGEDKLINLTFDKLNASNLLLNDFRSNLIKLIEASVDKLLNKNNVVDDEYNNSDLFEKILEQYKKLYKNSTFRDAFKKFVIKYNEYLKLINENYKVPVNGEPNPKIISTDYLQNANYYLFSLPPSLFTLENLTTDKMSEKLSGIYEDLATNFFDAQIQTFPTSREVNEKKAWAAEQVKNDFETNGYTIKATKRLAVFEDRIDVLANYISREKIKSSTIEIFLYSGELVFNLFNSTDFTSTLTWSYTQGFFSLFRVLLTQENDIKLNQRNAYNYDIYSKYEAPVDLLALASGWHTYHPWQTYEKTNLRPLYQPPSWILDLLSNNNENLPVISRKDNEFKQIFLKNYSQYINFINNVDLTSVYLGSVFIDKNISSISSYYKPYAVDIYNSLLVVKDENDNDNDTYHAFKGLIKKIVDWYDETYIKTGQNTFDNWNKYSNLLNRIYLILRSNLVVDRISNETNPLTITNVSNNYFQNLVVENITKYIQDNGSYQALFDNIEVNADEDGEKKVPILEKIEILNNLNPYTDNIRSSYWKNGTNINGWPEDYPGLTKFSSLFVLSFPLNTQVKSKYNGFLNKGEYDLLTTDEQNKYIQNTLGQDDAYWMIIETMDKHLKDKIQSIATFEQYRKFKPWFDDLTNLYSNDELSGKFVDFIISLRNNVPYDNFTDELNDLLKPDLYSKLKAVKIKDNDTKIQQYYDRLYEASQIKLEDFANVSKNLPKFIAALSKAREVKASEKYTGSDVDSSKKAIFDLFINQYEHQLTDSKLNSLLTNKQLLNEIDTIDFVIKLLEPNSEVESTNTINVNTLKEILNQELDSYLTRIDENIAILPTTDEWNTDDLKNTKQALINKINEHKDSINEKNDLDSLFTLIKPITALESEIQKFDESNKVETLIINKLNTFPAEIKDELKAANKNNAHNMDLINILTKINNKPDSNPYEDLWQQLNERISNLQTLYNDALHNINAINNSEFNSFKLNYGDVIESVESYFTQEYDRLKNEIAKEPSKYGLLDLYPSYYNLEAELKRMNIVAASLLTVVPHLNEEQAKLLQKFIDDHSYIPDPHYFRDSTFEKYAITNVDFTIALLDKIKQITQELDAKNTNLTTAQELIKANQAAIEAAKQQHNADLARLEELEKQNQKLRDELAKLKQSPKEEKITPTPSENHKKRSINNSDNIGIIILLTIVIVSSLILLSIISTRKILKKQ
ncbi:hypothetical protein NXS15_02810 [Mycoplasma sp. CSL7475-4]|uniref:coiled-coil domain-containing protein n=1 Tax=Mycoplasma sp. CSL7475-4 TaxID=2973942 RepID=UPI00216B10F0|nr:hypothetical protein [Mycoplasma sp. CSL7475-4]MCS4537042.1 hypothetical protein [Mycoplasma sp. CSL7475-4]